MEKEYIDKRTAILRAARELIAENGFSRRPDGDDRHHGPCRRRRHYRYFTDKDVLIKEVFN